MKHTNRSNLIFAVLFMVLCSLSLLGAIIPALSLGPVMTEKRDLATIPASSETTLAQWPNAIEAWFDDHFGFRAMLVRINSLFRYRAFNMSSSRTVLPGRDGWLFYDGRGVRGGDPRRNHLAQLPDEHEQLFSALKDQYLHNDQYFAAQGRTYLIVIVPDKWSVYAEQLPASVGAPAEQTSADLFVAYLRAETDLKILDLKTYMRENRWRYGPLYHQIDSHWNQLGAYVAAQEVSRFVSQYDERVAPLGPVPAVSWQPRSHGDLVSLLGLEGWLLENEPIVDPGLLADFETEHFPKPSNSTNHKRFPIRTSQPRPDLAKLLIMRDSYGDGILPWLAPSFQEVKWVWTSNIRHANIQPVVDQV
ncbi:MAG: alginate O-acetyltransferase complex protein AlgJ, partial [Candidatus Krumholzibacteriia bacterium]